MLILQKSKLNCRLLDYVKSLWLDEILCDEMERNVLPSLLSHTRGNDSFSQSARGLCANLQNHFGTGGLVIFLSTELQPLQYSLPCTRARRKIEDTKQDKRARGEAFWKVSAASVRVHRSANIKWSPLYHSCLSVLCRGRFPGSILSPPLPSVLFM